MAGKFEVSVDKSKKYRYTLKSGEGKALVKSEAYNSLAECKSKISALKKIVAAAEIVDLEAEKKKALAKKEAEAKAKKAAVEKAKKAAAAKKASAAKKPAAKKPAVKKAPAAASSDSPWGTH
jgi:uncharacterized protein YegP (UPF0339 family)